MYVFFRDDFPAAWMNLGIVLANTKRYDESHNAYHMALKYRKNYPDCYYNLGNLVRSIVKIYCFIYLVSNRHT